MSPQEAWQYGAVLLVVGAGFGFLHFLKKAGDKAIEAFGAIATRMAEHEEQDTIRHNEVVNRLDVLRERTNPGIR